MLSLFGCAILQDLRAATVKQIANKGLGLIRSIFGLTISENIKVHTAGDLLWILFVLVEALSPSQKFSGMSGWSHRFLGIPVLFWGGKCILLKDTTWRPE